MVRLVAVLMLVLVLCVSAVGAEVKKTLDISVLGEGYCFNSVSSLIRDETANFKKGDLVGVIADGETIDIVNSVLKLDGYRVVEKSQVKEKTRFLIEVK